MMNKYKVFENSEVVSIQPSTAVLTEFMRNGWSKNKLEHALSTKPWKDEEGFEESPLEMYKGGVGYLFEWGHIIETNLLPVADYLPFYSVNWEFSLDDLLSKAHLAGKNLDQLTDLCVEFISQYDRTSWPVFIVDGASMSAFGMIIQTADDSVINAEKEIFQARRWVVDVFFEEIFPCLLTFLDDELSGVNQLH